MHPTPLDEDSLVAAKFVGEEVYYSSVVERRMSSGSLCLSGDEWIIPGRHAKAPWLVRLRVQIPKAGRPEMDPYSAAWKK
jgi:hypothetical protein